MRIAPIAAALAFAGLTVSAAHAHSLGGTWRGQCTRPGQLPVNGDIQIHEDSVVFFGEPVEALDMRVPQISFQTFAESDRKSPLFTGSFNFNYSIISGILSEDSLSHQTLAACEFNFAQ